MPMTKNARIGAESALLNVGSMVAGRCSELRAGILSIYEKNPICVTRDVMLCVDREKGKEKEREKKRE